MTRHAVALAGSVALLVAIPWLALSRPTATTPLPPSHADAPLSPAPAVPVNDLLERPFFRSGDDAPTPVADDTPDTPADPDAPPRIAGIVGRLPDQAVVLVRRPEGGTRALSIGDAVGGWRLVSIGADAVLFTAGGRRARVELPPGD